MPSRHARFVLCSWICAVLLLSLGAAGAGDDSAGRIEVLVELDGAPAAVAYRQALPGGKARAAAAARRRLVGVERAQEDLLRALAAADVDAVVLGRTRRVLNAVALEVDAAGVERLRRLPGVARVGVLPPLRFLTASSVPFLGTPELWESLGHAGEGARIGIVDSGVDYVHPDFGGTGLAGDYAAREADASAFFPNGKVLGGWDFFDDDADPFDCNGHGTHVAGIAAGAGVGSDGKTYTGPYDGAIPFDAFQVAPGVAPMAGIFALRIGGCDGEVDTAAFLEALDWALDPDGDGDFSDRLDVVNLSVGAAFGHPDDAFSRAVDAAVGAGVAVVAAAGNSADVHFSVDSPSTAARALSVAATVDDGLPGARLTVHQPAGVAASYEGRPATNFGAGLTAGGVTADVATSLEPASTACEAITNPQEVAGKIALVDRGGCSFTTKAKNAQDAGAVAVVVVNLDEDLLAFGAVGGDPLAGAVTVPVVMIGFADGTLLRGAAAPRATLSSGSLPALADTLLPATSRGPARGGLAKPDLTAPGRAISSAVPPERHFFENPASGTSMAAAHVTGVLALLRELRGDWELHELKALLMNTTTGVYTGQRRSGLRYSPPRVGAGRLRAQAALAAQTVAYAAGDPWAVALAFDTVEVRGEVSETKPVRVVSHGPAAVTYTAAYEATTDAPGVDVRVPAGSFTVPAGGSFDLGVTLHADSSQMFHTPDPTLSFNRLESTRFFLTEESGYLLLSGDDGSQLRLPVYAAPRPAGRVHSARDLLFGNHTEVKLRGADVDTTALAGPPVGVVSILTGYELQHVSPDDPGTAGPLDAADLAYVGVTSDYLSTVAAGGEPHDARVYFALATHGNWSTPREVSFEVEIDVDHDRGTDFILSLSDFATLSGGATIDAYTAFLFDTRTGEVFATDPPNGLLPIFLDTVLFHTNVLMLSAPLELLTPVDDHSHGLGAPSPRHHPGGEEEHEEASSLRFDYFVRLKSRELDLYTDVTPWLSYDPARPGLDFNDARNASGFCPCPGPPYWFGQTGVDVPMRVFRANLRANGSLGALLLHHHNDSVESRAEVIFHGRRLRLGDVKTSRDDVEGGWRYFVWDAPEGAAPVTFSISAVEEEPHDDGEDDGEDDGHHHEDDGHRHGNPDLYVRFGAPPTQDSYDARSVNLGPEDSVTLEHPRPGRYYVGLLAVEAYEEIAVGLE